MKIRKKTLVDFVVISIAFLLFTIWYEHNIKDSYKVTSTTNAMKSNIIYLITPDLKDEFWHIMDNGAADMAKMLEVTYIFDAPKERDIDEQIRIVNNAIDRNADAILLAAGDPFRLSSVVEDAKARGINIVYVDSPAVEEGAITLATDNYKAGQEAGKIMLSRLEDAGVKTGTIGILGIAQDVFTTMERERGFRDVIKENGIYQVLDAKYTKGDINRAKVAADEYRKEQENLVGIFGTNEGNSIGLGKSLETTKDKLIAIGFDYTKEIQEMIDQGILQAVIKQSPYAMGYLGVAEAIALIKGYEVSPGFISTGITVIDKNTPKYLLPR